MSNLLQPVSRNFTVNSEMSAGQRFTLYPDGKAGPLPVGPTVIPGKPPTTDKIDVFVLNESTGLHICAYLDTSGDIFVVGFYAHPNKPDVVTGPPYYDSGLNESSNGLCGCKLTSTRFAIFYGDGTDLNSLVCSVNTSTLAITMGTPVTHQIDSVNSILTDMSATAYTSTTVLWVGYHAQNDDYQAGLFELSNDSDTSFTLADELSLDEAAGTSAYTRPDVIAISATAMLVSFVGSTSGVKTQVVSLSGSALSAGTADNPTDNTPTGSGSQHIWFSPDNTKGMCLMTHSDGYMTLEGFTVSGTTVAYSGSTFTLPLLLNEILGIFSASNDEAVLVYSSTLNSDYNTQIYATRIYYNSSTDIQIHDTIMLENSQLKHDTFSGGWSAQFSDLSFGVSVAQNDTNASTGEARLLRFWFANNGHATISRPELGIIDADISEGGSGLCHIMKPVFTNMEGLNAGDVIGEGMIAISAHEVATNW